MVSAPAASRIAGPGETVTLANGVRVYLDPMPAIASAAIGVWVRAGAMDETPEENGVAHLLEHMAFKGASRRDARAIAEDMEAVGGYLNAATGYSQTGYYARVLPENVDLAADIIADIMTAPTLDEGELEKEKGVVIQEIGEAWDTPDDALFEILQSLAFADQSLGRPILGDEARVGAHTADVLRGFMARGYRPGDIVIAAAGAIDPRSVLDLAEGYFGCLLEPESGKPPRRFAPTSGRRHEARDLEQTHFALSAPGVGLKDENYFVMRTFVEALGGGMASRLFQTIREDKGLAYSVYAFSDAYDDLGSLGVYAGVDSQNAEAALAASLKEIEAMAAAVSQPEVDRARAMLRASTLMSLESPLARAERAAAQLFTFGEVRSVSTVEAALAAVTPDAVRDFARRIVDGGALSLAVVGPVDFGRMEAVIS